MAQVPTIRADIVKAFKELLAPMRYKVYHGGRGSAKSWQFARCLIILASMYSPKASADDRERVAREFEGSTGLNGNLIRHCLKHPIRILCAREIQDSIKDSVHRLLVDQIEMLGRTPLFNITDHAITHKGGSDFIFEGLFRNVNRIKSIENVWICWPEEAESISDSSWDYLTPTIRAEDKELGISSEIWISFNPANRDDPTYQRFVENPPQGSIVRQVNYNLNPYFPKVLRMEMETDRARDPILYRHKWLGEPLGGGSRIWYPFDRDIHVKDFKMAELAETANCFMAMDPHDKYYPFCTWIAMVPRGKNAFMYVVYNEWPSYDDLGGYYSDLRQKLYCTMTIKDMARKFYTLDGAEYGIKIDGTYGRRSVDTRFAKGSGGSSWSSSTQGMLSEFQKKDNGGLIFSMPAEKMIDCQRSRILEMMRWNTLLPLSDRNQPEIFVMPHCRNTIQSLMNHRCEKDARRTDGTFIEKEDEKYKDPSDSVRINFATMADWRYNDPRIEADPVFAENVNEYAHEESWMAA